MSAVSPLRSAYSEAFQGLGLTGDLDLSGAFPEVVLWGCANLLGVCFQPREFQYHLHCFSASS